jgi:hypothetical protein
MENIFISPVQFHSFFFSSLESALRGREIFMFMDGVAKEILINFQRVCFEINLWIREQEMKNYCSCDWTTVKMGSRRNFVLNNQFILKLQISLSR